VAVGEVREGYDDDQVFVDSVDQALLRHNLFVRNGPEATRLVSIPALSGFLSPDSINLRIRSVQISQDRIDEPQLLDVGE
jgi:hypothetical protein